MKSNGVQWCPMEPYSNEVLFQYAPLLFRWNAMESNEIKWTGIQWSPMGVPM